MAMLETRPIPEPEPPLTPDELVALRKACCPVDLLTFPPAAVIHSLRRLGYVEIVLGGLQITPRGLERLLRERDRAYAPHDANLD